ncbi:MAG: DUF2911 domain-containing protein [Acidobacteria bacterium]|nr:DUF2911 domain-containing protein [Acidobacteriota bacterium]
MRATLKVSAALAIAIAVGAGPALEAQKTTEVHPGRGGSPHVKTEWTIDGANISIEYGRPALKGRSETELMPAGKPWRTGADEATRLTTDRPLRFGSVTLEPGTYTINTIPGESEWTLLVGRPAPPTEKRPQQWGMPYQPDLEIGKVPMPVSKSPTPVELLTISVDDTPQGGTLRIEWGSVRATAPFTIG